jgi:tetratricopeptide (TPR) repeat protein
MTDLTRLRRAKPLVSSWAVACVLLLVASLASAQQAQPQPALQPGHPPPASAPQPAAGAAAPTSPVPPPAPAEPTPEQREAAREAYARGQALFAAGNYAQAKAAFEQAYAAVPNPVVLVSSAECDVRLGNLEGAHSVLQQYLALRPDAPDRADVQQKIADLEATPAHLLLSSEPAGAKITIDGKDTGKVTPADVEVMRGDHAVGLSLDGYTPSDEGVTARIGARHELAVKLQPLPPPPTDLKPTVEAGQPTTALWITSIVGAAGLVTGTVLGFMTLAERSDFDAHPTKASADRGERLALFTDVAFGVGAMAAVTAVVLYVSANDPEPEPAPSISVEPAVSLNGAGLSARGRF